MNNPDICRYEWELGKVVQGVRRRKKVLEAFRRSLVPLLEEIDSPEYEDLIEAFGPPEQMAQELLRSVPGLPAPLRRREKLGIVLSLCVVIAAISWVGFMLWNTPEVGSVLAGANNGPDEVGSQLWYAADETFEHGDIFWDHPKEMSAYLVELHNTNTVSTKVTISYSNYRAPHSIELAPGEQCTFVVNDVRRGAHTVSFATQDGSLSGTIRVLLSQKSL